MSDPEVPEPDDAPADVNEVVDSANAGLAEAEAVANGTGEASIVTEPAFGGEASVGDAPITEPVVDPDLAAFEAAEREHPGTFANPEPGASSAPEPGAFAPPVTTAFDAPAETSVLPEASAETVVIPDAAPLAPAPAPAAAPAPVPQPMFVQAPEPPRVRGNRGFAGIVGLLAAIVFGVLYLGARLGVSALHGELEWATLGNAALAEIQTVGFWAAVVIFFLGFWLLGAIINRGRWGGWVIFGFLVGVIAYGGHIVGVLFDAPFWTLTSTQGLALVQGELLAPAALAAALFGREVTIWFGAWVARAGRHKTELNNIAQREYESLLEAGPTLAR